MNLKLQHEVALAVDGLPLEEDGVITVAAGKDLYFQMAATLARSFQFHHKGGTIGFAIATDQPDRVPRDVANFCRIVKINSSTCSGFELKLHLDSYSPFRRTLFIDADCLITGCLKPVFRRFLGQGFAVVGSNASAGEWFGDLAHRCDVIGLQELPVFVGAAYYFDDSSGSKKVFENARHYSEAYDELGIARLRGKINEEPLISLGMAINGFSAEPDTGEIKCDAMNFGGPIKVDVFSGYAVFCAPVQSGLNGSGAQGNAFPLIAHFNDAFARSWEYRRESSRLRLHFACRWPIAAARVASCLRVEFPGRLIRWCKETFRPFYHMIFGVRSISQNERV